MSGDGRIRNRICKNNYGYGSGKFKNIRILRIHNILTSFKLLFEVRVQITVEQYYLLGADLSEPQLRKEVMSVMQGGQPPSLLVCVFIGDLSNIDNLSVIYR